MCSLPDENGEPGRPDPPSNETDPRFPSGPWKGFFLDRRMPGRNRMELILTFREGLIRGEGRDRVGPFIMRGRYELRTGECHIHKTYIGRHTVFYKGYNEGKGIWGVWTLEEYLAGQKYTCTGGFHIWPAADGDREGDALEAEAPIEEAAAVC